MPPSIEQFLIDFERTLDQQIQKMNLNDDDDLPPFGPSRRPGSIPYPSAGFILPTPLSSSSSEDEESEPPSHGTSTRAEEEDAPVAPPASSVVARKPSPSPVPAVAPTNEPPYALTYLGFEYQRKNDNKKSVQYWCKSHRSKKDKCEGEVRFTKNKMTGEVDYDNPDFRNTSHTRTCFVKNKAPLVAYLAVSTSSAKNDVSSPGDVGKRSKIQAFTDVTQEMRDLTDDISTEHLTILPKTVWG